MHCYVVYACHHTSDKHVLTVGSQSLLLPMYIHKLYKLNIRSLCSCTLQDYVFKDAYDHKFLYLKNRIGIEN